MKIGFATMNDIQNQWANWYKEAVEKRSNGRIEVKIFPRGQLGPIASQIEGVQLGTIEAFTTAGGFLRRHRSALRRVQHPAPVQGHRAREKVLPIPR